MDGTLLRGTSAGLEIARRLDCLDELVELELAFAAGALDTRGFAAAVATLWGELTDELVAEAFQASPWINGLPDVLADIRDRGEHSMVVTMSPDFFAGLLRTVGVDEVAASRFPPLPLRRPPDPAHILSPADKVTIVAGELVRRGLSVRDCIAYGDSGSDMPLFRHLSQTVAVNATEELAGLAALRYDGDDLLEAYRLARTRYTDRGPRAASIL
jgi:phosphoserine phosphatase